MAAQQDGRRGHFHAVRFYEDDASLCRLVAEFAGDGLAAGEPVVIIATAAHADGIKAGLATLAFDPASRESHGELLFLDADQALATFMKDGAPDPDQFQRIIGGRLDQAARGRSHPHVRAYGEMVDLLWKKGATAAAVRLEVLWNQLAENRPFSLMCAYSMGNFYKHGAYEEICQQHSHVVSAGGAPVPVVVGG